MSVTTNTAKVQYTLSSAVQALPITFYFLDNSHIKAIRARTGVADVVLTLGTDYTLAGAGDEAGGTLTTIATNLQAGDKITIKRDIPITQLTNYVYNDKFPAEVHERVADKLTMAVQQLKEVTDRAVQFPESEVAGAGNIMPAAAGRASKILGFDATGNVVQLYDPVSAVFAQGDAIYANSVAALKAVSVAALLNGQQCHVGGYADVGDGAGGAFVYVAASAATEYIGAVVAPNAGAGRWFRVFSGPVNVLWFGAKNDNTTDATAAIQSAINYVSSLGGGTVYLPKGTYKISTGAAYSWAISLKSGVHIIGAGKTNTILSIPNTAEPSGIFGVGTLSASAVTGVRIAHIGFDGGVSDFTGLPLGGGYEYSSGIIIHHGSNIVVEGCAFNNFQGDGVIFGESRTWNAQSTTVSNVRVMDCDFVTIFREAIFLVNVNGVMIRNCRIVGAPYVAGIEVERHNAADTVKNIKIEGCDFEFTVYKSAVYCIMSGAGYVADDGLSSQVQISDCRVHNGCFAVRSFSNLTFRGIIVDNDNVDITATAFTSSNVFYFDPGDTSTTRDIFGDVVVADVIVSHKTTFSGNGGTALRANKTRNLCIKNFTCAETKSYGIFLAECSRAKIQGCEIRDVGTAAVNRAGIEIQYTCGGVIVSGCTIIDTRVGAARGMKYGIETLGFNAGRPPFFFGNLFSNCITADIYNDPSYSLFPVVFANASDLLSHTPGNGYQWTGSKSFYVGPLGAGAVASTTVTVTGAGLGDHAQVSLSVDAAGIIVNAWVSAANTVTVKFTNPTGGSIDIGTPTIYAYVRNR